VDGHLEMLEGVNPLEPYGLQPMMLKSIEHLVRQPNAGDLVIFGAYDGYEIVSFDDQIGAHGAAGGNQTYPFILGPAALGLDGLTLEDAKDVYWELPRRYEARATHSSPCGKNWEAHTLSSAHMARSGLPNHFPILIIRQIYWLIYWSGFFHGDHLQYRWSDHQRRRTLLRALERVHDAEALVNRDAAELHETLGVHADE